MKTSLFLFAATLFFSCYSFSQVWTSTNPVWHYDFWNVGQWGHIIVEQTGDTLIEGKTCQKLTAIKHQFSNSGPQGGVFYYSYPYGENYVYTSNDTVFYRQDEAFRVLFDFSADEGDSWLLSTDDPVFECNDSSYTTVDSVSSIDLGTETAVKLVLGSDTNNLACQYGAYNSHFGAMNAYLFPQWQSCDMGTIVEFDMITFKCFEDDELYYNPSGTDCEYWLTHLGVEKQEQLQLSVYPNPVSELLTVKVAEGKYDYRIVSVTGGVAGSGCILSPSANETVIKTDALGKGVYFLELSDGFSVRGRIRFVKQ